jgi:hypothetical protein
MGAGRSVRAREQARARDRPFELRCMRSGSGDAGMALGVNRYYLGPSGGGWNTAASWNTVEAGGGATVCAGLRETMR